MIKLEILNADGSLYWTEHFNNLNDQIAWLEEEKTRPYYKSDFTTIVTDLTPVMDEALVAREAKLAQIRELEATLTPRKLREAMLSGNMAEVRAVEDSIALIRATL